MGYKIYHDIEFVFFLLMTSLFGIFIKLELLVVSAMLLNTVKSMVLE